MPCVKWKKMLVALLSWRNCDKSCQREKVAILACVQNFLITSFLCVRVESIFF